MTEEEKSYWSLILLAKYVKEATDWNEAEFINIVYEDYRFEMILGCAFQLHYRDGKNNILRWWI